MGDLATAVPALRGLRRAFPGQHIQLAAPGWLAPLVELTGAVDELLPVAGLDGCIRWPSPSPQLAVNLHGRGPESHWLLHTADPKQLFGFACQAAGYHLGPVWRADEHEVARWCRMLRWYGIATDPTDLALAVPEGRPGSPDHHRASRRQVAGAALARFRYGGGGARWPLPGTGWW